MPKSSLCIREGAQARPFLACVCVAGSLTASLAMLSLGDGCAAGQDLHGETSAPPQDARAQPGTVHGPQVMSIARMSEEMSRRCSSETRFDSFFDQYLAGNHQLLVDFGRETPTCEAYRVALRAAGWKLTIAWGTTVTVLSRPEEPGARERLHSTTLLQVCVRRVSGDVPSDFVRDAIKSDGFLKVWPAPGSDFGISTLPCVAVGDGWAAVLCSQDDAEYHGQLLRLAGKADAAGRSILLSVDVRALSVARAREIERKIREILKEEETAADVSEVCLSATQGKLILFLANALNTSYSKVHLLLQKEGVKINRG
jgi:hypothetical protein